MRTVTVTPALVLVLLVGACKDKGGGTGPESFTIAKAGGDGQSAAAGTAVAAAPSVRVTDQDGQGVSGVPVTFAVASGGGSVSGAAQTTDASGTATVGGWTLGAMAGANSLTATSNDSRVKGGPLTFTATGNAGAAAKLAKAGGDTQTATVGQAVGTAPSVLVTDAFDNPVSGAAVSFAATAGAGSVVGAAQTTGASGIATVGAWVLGNIAGANTLTATATGTGISGNPVSFSATGLPGPAASIAAAAGDNQTAATGTAVAIAPAVRTKDVFGNDVANVAVEFTVGSGGGSVSGGSKTTDAGGLATVGGWTLGPNPGANTLVATAQGAGLTGNPVTFSATAQAVLNALQYAGSWSGNWTNTTFGSTGTTTLGIAVDTNAKTVSLTSSSTGNVLGQGGVAQQSRMSAYDDTGFQLSTTVSPYGDVTLTVDGQGAITASGANVPAAGIDSWTANGTITTTVIQLSFTVNFTGGGTAVGTITINKQ